MIRAQCLHALATNSQVLRNLVHFMPLLSTNHEPMEAQNKFRCPSIVDIHDAKGVFLYGRACRTNGNRYGASVYGRLPDLNLAPNSWYHLVLPPLKTSEHSSPTIFARHVCLSFSAKSLILKAGPSDSIVNLDGFTL
jgi:hypothetical protein